MTKIPERLFNVILQRAPEKRRGMSVASRAKVAAAQKARWAKVRGVGEKLVKKGRRKMSAGARAKISAAAKLRWKNVKAAGKSRL